MREGSKTYYARSLRKDSTKAEARLWEQLRNRQFGGFKFVRQFPIGPYIVDFACRELSLIIEIDGATHSSSVEVRCDATRSAYLKQRGFRVVRFQNSEILEALDQVLAALLENVSV